ncbi:MAG: F0F1 ATP synthase subunit delta [Pseudomonadota bacterium]
MTTEDTSVSEQAGVSGVAGRYASALFELAKDAKSVDTVAADLDGFGALLAENDDLKRLVRSPVFGAEEQAAALGAILAKAKISGLTGNFVQLVARNRRLFSIEDIIAAFRALAAADRGEVSASVTSAQELKPAQIKSLQAALKSITGKTVTLNQQVDPSILGGLIVKVGSRMIDTSLKTKLNSLKLRMKEVG